MLCVVILYIDLQFKSRLWTTDFLRNFFMAGLFILRVFARNLMRANRRINIFCILLGCLNPGTCKYIQAYIIGHYNSSVRITTYLLTLLTLCVLILCKRDRDLRREITFMRINIQRIINWIAKCGTNNEKERIVMNLLMGTRGSFALYSLLISSFNHNLLDKR